MHFATSNPMRKVFAAAALLGCLSGACSESTPATPTPPAITLNGRWIGSISVLGTTAAMTWTLTQSGTTVNGPVTVGLSTGTVLLNGFLTGTLNGSTLTYSIAVGPGGVPAQPACVGQFGGTMTVTIGATSTLAGNVALTSSTCTAPLPGGNVTLTRQ
jgi:hypothetical protein